MKKIFEQHQILQQESGSACFSMVAGFYKKWISLEEAYVSCCVTAKGCSPEGILFAAEKYGFKAQIVDASIKDFSTLKLPLILCGNDGHYLVLERIKTDKRYVLCDPQNGHLTCSRKRLKNLYAGKAICIYPGPDFKTGGERGDGFYTGRKVFMRNAKASLLYSLGLALVAGFAVAFPNLNSSFADKILSGDESPNWIVIIYLALLLISALLHLFNVFMCRKITRTITSDVNSRFEKKLFNLPLSYYSIRNPGDLARRKTDNYTTNITIATKFCELLVKLCMVLVCLVIIGIYSYVMLLIIILLTVLMYVILGISIKKGSAVNNDFYSKMDMENLSLYDMFVTMTTIRNAGAETLFMRKALLNMDELCKAKQSRSIYTSIFDSLTACFTNLIKLVIVGVGVYLTWKYQTPLGIIVAVEGLYDIILDPIKVITSTGSNFLTMEHQLERISAIEKAPEHGQVFGDTDNPEERLFGDICLNNINFSYVLNEAPFIKDLSMEIHQGEFVAIVGASASGKTTLKRLIMGELTPGTGSITYSGQSRNEISDKLFQRSIAAVDQSITLFPDTVMNNIKMWDEAIPDYSAILAARDAGIYELIMSRPGDFNCMVAEKGKNFSGGEKQRIEIARALAKDPSILIFDEATSALDAVIEKQLTDRCTDRGITMIIIAHRLSTIRNCDRIFVMDHGEIIASGTHEELYNNCSIYHNLVTKE